MKIVCAESAADFAIARELFREYARSLDFNLCFQNFETELEQLPVMYADPGGALLLAYTQEDQPAGCVALRTWGPGIGEMKRLYVRAEHRGSGLGRILTERLIEVAGRFGLTRIRLDTVPSMQAAIALYRSLGFREVTPYRENPIEGALYLEREI